MFLNEYFSKLWALENLTLQSFWSLVTIHILLTFHQVLFFVLIYLYILFQGLLVTVLSPASKELGQWRFQTFFKNFEVCWVLPLLFSFHIHWWLIFAQILDYSLLSLSYKCLDIDFLTSAPIFQLLLFQAWQPGISRRHIMGTYSFYCGHFLYITEGTCFFFFLFFTLFYWVLLFFLFCITWLTYEVDFPSSTQSFVVKLSWLYSMTRALVVIHRGQSSCG